MKDRLRRNLDAQSQNLVYELRDCSAGKSGILFARFMQDTGADLLLLNENSRPIDLFTFKTSDEAVLSGMKYPFRFAGSENEYILIVRFNPARSQEISNAIWRSLPWVEGMHFGAISNWCFSLFSVCCPPIIRMSGIAARIAELDFSWYCPDLREDELGVLASSINELSDRLSSALYSLRSQNSSLEDEINFEKNVSADSCSFSRQYPTN